MQKLYYLILIFLTPFITFTQDILLLKGKVVDKQDGESLPSTNIYIKNKNIGTVSNLDGTFHLKIPQKNIKDTLVFSYLGYQSYFLPLIKIEKAENILVKLLRNNIELDKIEVHTLSTLDIITKCIEKIPDNYTHNSYLYTFFAKNYSEDSHHKTFLSQQYDLLELVGQTYFPNNFEDKPAPYYPKENKVEAQTQLLKGRRLAHYQNSWDAKRRYRYIAPIVWYYFDFSLKQNTFLDKKYFRKYDYHLDSLIYQDDTPIYVISFDKKPKMKPTIITRIRFIFSKKAFLKRVVKRNKSLMKGKLYIDANTFAIIQLETYQDENYLSAKPRKGVKESYQSYVVVAYHKFTDKYQPKYIKTTSYAYDKNIKKQDTVAHYKSIYEILVTNVEKVAQNPIQEDKKLDYDNQFKQLLKVREDKDDFWENYNVLTSLDFNNTFKLDTAKLPNNKVVHILSKSRIAHEKIRNGQYTVKKSKTYNIIEKQVKQATVSFKKEPYARFNVLLKQETEDEISFYNGEGTKVFKKNDNSIDTLSEYDNTYFLYENELLLPILLKSNFFFLELLQKTMQKDVKIEYELDNKGKQHIITFRQNPSGIKMTYILYLDVDTYLVKKISYLDYEKKGDYYKIDYDISNTNFNQKEFEAKQYYEVN